MSTTIGKEHGAVPAAEASARADQEKRASQVEKDARAHKFKAALGKPAPGEAEREAAAAKARDNSPTKKPAEDKDEGPRRAGAGSSGTEGASNERERRPVGGAFGLTEEQAMAVEALGGAGVAGVGGKKGREGGPGGEGPGAGDDMGAGSVGGPEGVKGKGAISGEEAIQEVAAAVSAAAAGNPAMGWLRPEGPSRPEARNRELPTPMAGVDPIHQLLIGKGPNGAEARMTITTGPLAGTEIQLREGPGGVQAAIMTQSASARQTLTSALEAVAERLKAKGQTLEVRINGTTVRTERGADANTASRASSFPTGRRA